MNWPVLVTGTSSGLGLETALYLAAIELLRIIALPTRLDGPQTEVRLS